MEFNTAVTELEALVQTLERERDERALLALELVDAIHRPALERIAAGELEHPLAQALLAMYGFAPLDDDLEVLEALDDLHSSIESEGAEVELLDVDDGLVHLRIAGDSLDREGAERLRGRIEGALRERFPGFKGVVAREPEGTTLPVAASGPPPLAQPQGGGTPLPQAGSGGTSLPQAQPGASPLPQAPPPGGPLPPVPAGSTPLHQAQPQRSGDPQAKVLQLGNLKRPVFADVARADELAPGETKAVMADDLSVLLLNVEGEIYAFKNACAADGMPLEGGRLANDAVLVCPWQNCAYDARSGKRVDEPEEPGLAVLPVRLENGAVRVAVDVQ